MNMKDFSETLGIATVLVVVIGMVVGIVAAVFIFYGAIFGAIAAGAYVAFKWIVVALL